MKQLVCTSLKWAALYALNIDKEPRDDTREAACKHPYYAYFYALYVDKKHRNDTWSAVQNTKYEEEYKNKFNLSNS